MTVCVISSDLVKNICQNTSDGKDIEISTDMLATIEDVIQKCRLVSVCERIIKILNSVFDNKNPQQAFRKWDHFFRSPRSLQDIDHELQSIEKCSWVLFSGLTPFVPPRVRALSGLMWRLAMLCHDTSARYSWAVDAAMILVGMAFPSGGAMKFLATSRQIVGIMANRTLPGAIRGMATLMRRIKPAQRQIMDLAVVSGTPEYFDMLRIIDPTAIVEPSQQRSQGMKLSSMVSRNSTLLTKIRNMSSHALVERLEAIILANPFLQENANLVPLALALLHGARKAVVIDKYDSLVRAFNNKMRRTLGQKIKPTRNDPIALIMSGKVRPIVRRDLLISNILLIIAYMKDEIAREIAGLFD